METIFVVDPKRQRCGCVADIPLARRCGEFCQQSGKISVSCCNDSPDGFNKRLPFCLLWLCAEGPRCSFGFASVRALQENWLNQLSLYGDP